MAKVSKKNSGKKKSSKVREVSPGVQVKKDEKAFREAVVKFKKEHPGDLLQVNLLTDEEVVRAVAAWPNVPREINKGASDMDDPWKMIWYAPGTWMDMARIPLQLELGVMLAVRQNNLIYPDGTLPRYVRMHLEENGRIMLGLPHDKSGECAEEEDGD